MKKIVLIGGGGYCASVIDSLKKNSQYEIVGITDPMDKGECCGIPIIGTDEILPTLYESGVKYAHVTVGSIGKPTLRIKLVKMAKEIGFDLVTIIDSTAVLADSVTIGKMNYIGKKAVVNSNVEIGDYCIINTSSVVEHGCKLGNWVHVAPMAALAGDIIINDRAHIGINATVLQGVVIGSDVIVGAGSTVLRNVPSGKTVYGIVKE